MEVGAQWFEAMRRGDLSRAWDLSDAVLRSREGRTPWHLPRREQWLWDGRPLRGKRVLVHGYHGLGDTLQFMRYVPSPWYPTMRLFRQERAGEWGPVLRRVAERVRSFQPTAPVI